MGTERRWETLSEDIVSERKQISEYEDLIEECNVRIDELILKANNERNKSVVSNGN